MLSLCQFQKDGRTCPRSPGEPAVPRTKLKLMVGLRLAEVTVSVCPVAMIKHQTDSVETGLRGSRGRSLGF